MRSFDDPRGIGFLLSLIALPLTACPSDDGDATASADDDSTGADDDGTTMTDPSVTMSADDSGSSGPSTVDDSTGSSGPDPTTPTEGDSDSGSSGDATGNDSSTGGESLCPEEAEVSQVCTDFAEHTVVCYPDYAGERPMIAHECTCYLEYYAPSYGESCGTAVEEYYACLVTADCEEITSETACLDERMVVDMECV